jgi:sialate O-acetylesterase
VILVSLILLTEFNSFSQDFRQVKSLSGSWKFSVGDNPRWADPNFDDSDWGQIRVPDNWEDQGYDDYDGFAWYRKTFEINEMNRESSIYLCLGRIDDVSEIYINGKFFARTGSFPPNYETKYSEERIFLISKNLLQPYTEITIAVRVYDMIDEGGITGGKIGLYYDYDIKYIDYPITGKWKFKTGRDKDWARQNYPDENWNEIIVPGTWESQGYDDYDGYAWYRKSFSFPQNADKDELYLVLGKIDDYDYVYLNGELLGSYKTNRHNLEYRLNRDTWRNIRYYPIPKGLLKSGENQIAVQVLDEQGSGGIYAGPIGITSEDNYYRLRRKYRQNSSFFEFLLESIFD